MKQRYLSIALLMLCTGVHADSPITMSKAVVGYKATGEKQCAATQALKTLKDVLPEEAYFTCEKAVRGIKLSNDDYAQIENIHTLLAERKDIPEDVMDMLARCMQMKRFKDDADRAPHTVPSGSQIQESQSGELGEVIQFPVHVFAEKDIIATQGVRGRFGFIDNDINSQALNFAAGGLNATDGGTATARDSFGFNFASRNAIASSTNSSDGFNLASVNGTATSNDSNGFNFAAEFATASSSNSNGFNFASFGATARSNNSDSFNFATFLADASSTDNSNGFNFASRNATVTSTFASDGFNFASQNATIISSSASAINMVARGGTLGDTTTPYGLEGINLNAGTETDGFIRQYTNDLQRWQLTNEGGVNAGLGGIEAGATGVLDSDVGFNVLIQGSGNATALSASDAASFNFAMGQDSVATSNTTSRSFNVASIEGSAISSNSNGFNFASREGTATSNDSNGFNFASFFGTATSNNSNGINFASVGAATSNNSSGFNFASFDTATSNNSSGFNFASFGTATSNNSSGFNFASFGTATSNNSDGFNFTSRATATSNDSNGFNFASFFGTATSSGFSHGFNFASRNAEIHTATASAINMVARGGTLGEPTTPYELEGINLNAGTEADGFIRQYTNDLQRWQLTNEGGVNAGLGGIEAGATGVLDSDVGFNVLIQGSGSATALSASDAASFNLAIGNNSEANSNTTSRSFNVASIEGSAISSNSNGFNFAAENGFATAINQSNGFNFAAQNARANANDSNGFNFSCGTGAIARSNTNSNGFNFAAFNASANSDSSSGFNFATQNGTAESSSNSRGFNFASSNATAGSTGSNGFNFASGAAQEGEALSSNVGGSSANGLNIALQGALATSTNNCHGVNIAIGEEAEFDRGRATSNDNSSGFNFAARNSTAVSSGGSSGFNFATLNGDAVSSNGSSGYNFAGENALATSDQGSRGFNFATGDENVGNGGQAMSTDGSAGFNFATTNPNVTGLGIGKAFSNGSFGFNFAAPGGEASSTSASAYNFAGVNATAQASDGASSYNFVARDGFISTTSNNQSFNFVSSGLNANFILGIPFDDNRQGFNVFVDGDGSTANAPVSNIRFFGLPVFAGTSLTLGSGNRVALETSSKRFKQNIEDLDQSLQEKAYQLRPVSFMYKNDDEHKEQIGLIAEEVNELIPELVNFDEDGNPFSIKYSQLTSVLLSMIKELKVIIDRHEQEIQELKSKM